MELASKRIAIIGAGASGCFCAYFLLKSGYNVTLFDKGAPLRTLLPTGGGRCNLAHAEFNPLDLAKNYPRGEKFLYSVFSKFSTADTLEVFEEMGINTYTQENGRIFPESNSAKDVRETILKNIHKADFVKENVIGIEQIEGGFKVNTAVLHPNLPHPVRETAYFFTHIVLAIGGHAGYKLAENLGIKIIESRPSLVGLNTKENFKDLSGTVVKGVNCNGIIDDLLFTHFGLSGPIVYTISSLKAFDEIPYQLEFDLCPILVDLQNELNSYPHKEVKNILNKYLPQRVINYILRDLDGTTKAHQINGKIRDLILDRIHHFKVNIIGTNKGEETVSAGGIDLNEINPKTMAIKKIPNLYAIGEVLNIDGFCGGFNLQNAWSTAYICANALKE